MVNIHIDLFHAYYSVYLEDNRQVRCIFFHTHTVSPIMDSFAPEVTIESFRTKHKTYHYEIFNKKRQKLDLSNSIINVKTKVGHYKTF